MADFVDRVGRATVAQMSERFGLSGRVCWRRLQALREAGLVQTAQPLMSLSILYPKGTSPPRVRDLGHSLAATSTTIEYELAGVEVVTERMMRREEHSLGRRDLWSVAMPGASRIRTHRPDLALRTSGGLVAVEIELTAKSKDRLGRLMSAWAAQGSYQQVLYLCGSIPLERLIASQSTRMGAELVVRTALLDS